ncbi:hypothetical protein M3Y98_00509700 [Aphelenchoides besseyi]|nr:hypothetical protein M3Y98_00509700 [Aphelenchoides besseyi]KAI6207839.1 hypothetical protein M3Y96_00051500 [Aphelenchoides besseyi]
MYCLQYMLPVLLIPKPLVHPTFLIDHALFLWFYVIGFLIDKRPCHIVMFLICGGFLCYSASDSCTLWPLCEPMADADLCKRQLLLG